MLSCKTYNIRDYRVSLRPFGYRAKFRLPSAPNPSLFSEFGVGSTYYWLPYYNGIAIDLMLRAESTSPNKILVALDYEWRWFYLDKTKPRLVTSGEEILRGGFIEDGALSGDFRIPFEYVSQPGQYILQVRICERNTVVLDWRTIANCDISQWSKFVFGVWFAGVGVLGIILGVVIAHFIK